MNDVGLPMQLGMTRGMTLRNLTCYVVAITIFLSIGPFFAWSSFANGLGVLAFKALQIISIIFLMTQLSFNKLTAAAFLSAVSIFAIFLFYCFFTGLKSGTTHPLLIGNILVYFFYALNVVTDRKILLKSFEILRMLFAIVLGYTLIIHILILFGVPLPYVILQSGEAGRAEAGFQFYQNYLGCLLINQSGSLLYRFTSVFTEPGVVGTFCAFFLASSDFKLNKNKKNTLFLISGIFSLSVAFYLMAALSYMLKALRKGGYKAFSTIAALLVIYIAFINMDFSSPTLITLQERLMITESGLAGDNRIKEQAEAAYQRFLNGDLKTVLFGYGYPDVKADLAAWQATASYKESIYYLGFIGYGLMIAWLIITPLICYRSKEKKKNRAMYSYMIIFILSQYQRPYMKSLFLVYILLAGCLYAQYTCNCEE